MEIYIIDTVRINAWENAVVSPIFVHNHGAIAHSLSSGDIVFAHAHERWIGEDTDFDLSGFLRHYTHRNAIQHFCKSLVDSHLLGVSPLVILYAGECMGRGKASAWQTKAAAAVGPLPGYSQERIKVLTDGIKRGISGEKLRVDLDAILTGLGIPLADNLAATEVGDQIIEHNSSESGKQQRSEYVGRSDLIISRSIPQGTISVADSLRQPSQTALALRLLCQAWRHVNEEGQSHLYGMRIQAPQSIGQWLTPFGVIDQTQIPEVFRTCGYGDIESKALAIFTAAASESKELDNVVNEYIAATEP